jgi:hypothetical protein
MADTWREIADGTSLRPRLLIHGHTTLTEQFTAGAVAGLQAALTQLHGQVLDAAGARLRRGPLRRGQ